MSQFGKLEKSLRPILFFGNNWISLIGGALTTASAFVLIGFWVVSIFGHGGSNQSLRRHCRRPVSAGAVCPGADADSDRHRGCGASS